MPIFNDWRRTIWLLGLGLMGVSIGFLTKSLHGPVMRPEVYGAAIYAIPAEAWSLWFITSATAQFIGGFFRCRRLVIFGGTMLTMAFGAFAYWSASAGFGDVVTLFAARLFVPLEAFFVFVAMYGGDE